jgi:hypothetical protein
MVVALPGTVKLPDADIGLGMVFSALSHCEAFTPTDDGHPVLVDGADTPPVKDEVTPSGQASEPFTRSISEGARYELGLDGV